jgi:hypothetical protein
MSSPFRRHQVKNHIFARKALHPQLGPTAKPERGKVLGYGDRLDPRNETISPGANPRTCVRLRSGGIVRGCGHPQAVLVLRGNGTNRCTRGRHDGREHQQRKENLTGREHQSRAFQGLINQIGERRLSSGSMCMTLQTQGRTHRLLFLSCFNGAVRLTWVPRPGLEMISTLPPR